MLKHVDPSTVASPASRYSQAVEAPPHCRWLYVSGQGGVAPDGTLEKGFQAQAERAWRNLIAVLQAANLDAADLVRVNA